MRTDVSKRIWAVLVTSLVVGCGQVIDRDLATGSDGPPPDPPPDPLRVTFSAAAVYIGGVLTTVPFEFNDATLKGLAVDGSAPGGFRALPVAFAGSTASFELPMGQEGVWQVNMPPPFDTAPRFFPIADATRVWKVPFQVSAGAGAAIDPPPDASLDINVTTGDAFMPGDYVALEVAGLWILHNTQILAQGKTWDPPPVPYNQLLEGSEVGRRTITTNDRVYLTHTRQTKLISAMRVPPFSLSPGANSITGLLAVHPNRTVSASTSASEANARLAGVPAELLINEWFMTATNSGPYNNPTGIELAQGKMDLATGRINATFASPFEPDLKPFLEWRLQILRYERDPDGTIWALYSGFVTFDREPATGRVYTTDVGLPTSVSLNGVRLDTARKVVALPPGQPIELSFTADRMDGAYRRIDCSRFDPAINWYTLVFSTRVLGDRVRIPGNSLKPGVRYLCRPIMWKGVPNASKGDELARDPILRYGFHDSASFIVQ